MSRKEEVFKLSVCSKEVMMFSKFADASYIPLVPRETEQTASIRFQRYGKKILLNLGQEQIEKHYSDICKIEAVCIGVVLYFKNGTYLPLAVGKNEKHNIALADIITLLRRRCPFRYRVKEEVDFPEYENTNDRYKTDEEPLGEISFSFTDRELRSLLIYQCLIGDHLIAYLLLAVFFSVLSIALCNFLLLPIAALFAVVFVGFYLSVRDELERYRENHQGILSMLMYSKDLVIRLRFSDVDLAYEDMKKPRTFLGLWRLPAGEFFNLVLPRRIVSENTEFFEMLYKRI